MCRLSDVADSAAANGGNFAIIHDASSVKPAKESFKVK